MQNLSFQEGEICIKGLNVAVEYLGMIEKNRTAFRNGWFHSGDFGYKDDKGYYYFNCRKDNLIIKGGENIYPAELENVLFQHNSHIYNNYDSQMLRLYRQSSATF